MRKAEFKTAAKQIFVNNEKYFELWQVEEYKWSENFKEVELNELFFSESEARKAAEASDPSVGYTVEVNRVLVPYVYFNEHFGFQEEFNLEEVMDIALILVEGVWSEVCEGENIEGAILVEWSWEKYIGYCRNLHRVGIAGEGMFYEIKNTADLSTGGEDYTNRRTYSILLDKNEVEEADDIAEAIREALGQKSWLWNHFQNRNFIEEQIENLANEKNMQNEKI